MNNKIDKIANELILKEEKDVVLNEVFTATGVTVVLTAILTALVTSSFINFIVDKPKTFSEYLNTKTKQEILYTLKDIRKEELNKLKNKIKENKIVHDEFLKAKEEYKTFKKNNKKDFKNIKAFIEENNYKELFDKKIEKFIDGKDTREHLVISTLIKEVVEQILKDYKKKYGKTIDLKDALLSSFESNSKSDELSVKIGEKADNIKGIDINKFSQPLMIESYYDKIAYELLQEEPFTLGLGTAGVVGAVSLASSIGLALVSSYPIIQGSAVILTLLHVFGKIGWKKNISAKVTAELQYKIEKLRKEMIRELKQDYKFKKRNKEDYLEAKEQYLNFKKLSKDEIKKVKDVLLSDNVKKFMEEEIEKLDKEKKEKIDLSHIKELIYKILNKVTEDYKKRTGKEIEIKDLFLSVAEGIKDKSINVQGSNVPLHEMFLIQ